MLKSGKILAWLCIIFGAVRLSLALWVSATFETQEAMIAASRRYLATENSGEAIDRALYTLAFGIVLGVLAKIANGKSAA